ncbi:MAG: hypothetical protein JXR88_12085 [Clostridia bacterium]|nr:hypothetical protein [Clostridia bacterium]
MFKFKTLLLNFALYFTYGILISIVCKYVFTWIWLYSFLVPGMMMSFYGIFEFLKKSPNIPTSRPAVTGNEAQNNLLNIDFNVQVESLIKNATVKNETIEKRKPIHYTLFKREWYESLLVGFLFIYLAYFSYFGI